MFAKQKAKSGAVLACLCLATGTANASMGNLGTSYGLLPTDLASAQALSMFSEQASATYYNPSYLTADERGEMTAGILHSEQELRASRSDANGDVLADSPSQHVLLGFKTNLLVKTGNVS